MNRYARQTILPEIGENGQNLFAKAHILVVGAGGLGSTVIPALAGAGVGRLTLMDADTVSETNLHRQTLYTMAEIGALKVECAARFVVSLNPEIDVRTKVSRLTPDTVAEALSKVTLVIDAADSFAATYILSDYCHAQKLPMISASVLGRNGYAGGFCGNGPSYRALFPSLPQQAQSCATAGVMGPAVACLGALQAQMALATLLGLTPSPIGQMVSVDLAQYRFSSFRFDTAPEPVEDGFPFISANEINQNDQVVELRPVEESPEPAAPNAVRIPPDAMNNWVPDEDRRVVLCCKSGLRAWRAANLLHERGYHDMALLAVGD